MKPSDPFLEVNNGDRTVIRPSPGGRRPPSPAMPISPGPSTDRSANQLRAIDVEKDNPLLDSASSLLSLVTKLRHLPVHNEVLELQEHLVNELKSFESRALNQGVSPNQMNISKYLLCSLLDETVLNTPWGSSSGWGHNSLSSIFYKKLIGGEEFFQILHRLKQQPSLNRHLLELAYLCLSLGFEGKYRYTNEGLLTLEKERQDLYLLIQKIKGAPPPELSTQWRGVGNVSNPLMRYIPLWVLACVTGVVLMLIYMVFALTLRTKSDQVYDELFALAQNIKKAPAMQLVQPIQMVKPPTAWEDRFKALLASEIAKKQVAVIDGQGLRLFNMFPSGKAEIRPEYGTMLAKIAQALHKEEVRILIIGHTDNQRLKFSTRFKSNWHLSLARAKSTAMALGKYGLPDKRVRFEGMADNDPIGPNNSKANRALNRRIDIQIRGKM